MHPQLNMSRCFLFTLEICTLVKHKCTDWYIIISFFKATKRTVFGRIGSIIVFCCLIFLLFTQSPQITIYSFYHRLIACKSMQTAKFHKPVTLDFLDAELENEIKVEVWQIDYSALMIPQAHNRINSVDSIILFFYFNYFVCFLIISWTDKEENDRWSNRELHNIHTGEIPRWGNCILEGC